MNIETAIAMLATMNMNPQSSPSPEINYVLDKIEIKSKSKNRPVLIDDKKMLPWPVLHIARGQVRMHVRQGGASPACKPRCKAPQPPGALSSLQASPLSILPALHGSVR